MFVSSIKKNRLISKWLWHIYLKVTIEDNWPENFDFLSLQKLSPGQFLESSNSRRYYWISKLFVATEKSEVLEQNCIWLFYYFNFYFKLWRFQVKKSMYFVEVEKDTNFYKKEMESNMENPTQSFKETDLELQLI